MRRFCRQERLRIETGEVSSIIPAKTPANGLCPSRATYQKKSRESEAAHGFSEAAENSNLAHKSEIMLLLDGKTQIKNQITYSKFESAPDAPFTTFETVLPAGPHSALTANLPKKAHFNLCSSKLSMPTEIVARTAWCSSRPRRSRYRAARRSNPRGRRSSPAPSCSYERSPRAANNAGTPKRSGQPAKSERASATGARLLRIRGRVECAARCGGPGVTVRQPRSRSSIGVQALCVSQTPDKRRESQSEGASGASDCQ